MRKIIEKLRNRPEHHKKAVAFGVSFVVMAAVFSIWFSTQTFFGGTTVIAQAQAAKPESPFSTFTAGISSAWNGFSSIFK